jgi:hypothetical protein
MQLLRDRSPEQLMRGKIGFLRTQYDWVIVGSILLLIVVSLFVGLPLLHGHSVEPTEQSPELHTYAPPSSDLYQIVPPAPAYPVSAKEQRAFYMTYTEKEISYNIEKLNINIDRNPSLGKNTYEVSLYNSANRVITPTEYLKSISIDCIARDNPYRPVTSTPKPLTFSPYETKDITLYVDVDCMYLGTADGQYFWRVY